jgi:hypothetical protein
MRTLRPILWLSILACVSGCGTIPEEHPVAYSGPRLPPEQTALLHTCSKDHEDVRVVKLDGRPLIPRKHALYEGLPGVLSVAKARKWYESVEILPGDHVIEVKRAEVFGFGARTYAGPVQKYATIRFTALPGHEYRLRSDDFLEEWMTRRLQGERLELRGEAWIEDLTTGERVQMVEEQ